LEKTILVFLSFTAACPAKANSFIEIDPFLSISQAANLHGSVTRKLPGSSLICNKQLKRAFPLDV
jgi:hypothetical protein